MPGVKSIYQNEAVEENPFEFVKPDDEWQDEKCVRRPVQIEAGGFVAGARAHLARRGRIQCLGDLPSAGGAVRVLMGDTACCSAFGSLTSVIIIPLLPALRSVL